MLGVHIERGILGEEVAGVAVMRQTRVDVTPRSHDQPLRVLCRRGGHHVLIVMEGAEQIFQVVPAGDVEHGHVEGVVPVVITNRFPEVVQRVAADHVLPDRAGGIDELADLLDRQPAQDLFPVVGFDTVELGDAAAHHVGPPAEIELQAAVGVGDLLLPASGGRGRDHGGEVGRVLRTTRPIAPSPYRKDRSCRPCRCSRVAPRPIRSRHGCRARRRAAGSIRLRICPGRAGRRRRWRSRCWA